jgi:hypothetical protein
MDMQSIMPHWHSSFTLCSDITCDVRVWLQAYNLQGHVVESYQKLLHVVNNKNKLTSVMGGIALGYL